MAHLLSDTSVREKEHAGIGGTERHHGFGVLNYLYERLVTGNRSSAAIAIVMIVLVIGGSFGVVIRTGAINTGMYAFVNQVGKYEILIIPGLTFLLGLAGAVFLYARVGNCVCHGSRSYYSFYGI